MEHLFIKEEKLNIILKQMAFSNAAFRSLYRGFRFRQGLGQNAAKQIVLLERPISILI